MGRRGKAAGIHLGISATIAVVVVLLMLLVWYPEPYFDAMGGEVLVAILIGVDVVLGPFITLLVVSPTKARHLVILDLCVIGAVQLAALVYGVSVVAQARPVYLVFSVDRFDVTSAAQIRPQEVAKVARPEFQSLPLLGPRLVATRMPKDPDEQYRILMSAIRGADINTFPQHFVDYAEMAAEALKRSKGLDKLREYNPNDGPVLDKELARLGRVDAGVRFLPVKARKRDIAALIDANSGSLLSLVPLTPWL